MHEPQLTDFHQTRCSVDHISVFCLLTHYQATQSTHHTSIVFETLSGSFVFAENVVCGRKRSSYFSSVIVAVQHARSVLHSTIELAGSRQVRDLLAGVECYVMAMTRFSSRLCCVTTCKTKQFFVSLLDTINHTDLVLRCLLIQLVACAYLMPVVSSGRCWHL